MNGFLLVDKPAGIAFSSVIKAVKRKFGLDKVGHGGSLDTMASGLFIVLLGDANKFAADVMGADRAFEGSFKLGLNTNTGDIHGEISGPGAATIDPAKVKGDIFQREPRYCSIRKEGKADYEVVDTGEHPEFMAHVYRLELDGNAFRLKCTARTIVRRSRRSWAWRWRVCGARPSASSRSRPPYRSRGSSKWARRNSPNA